jgi:hypothetical protein
MSLITFKFAVSDFSLDKTELFAYEGNFKEDNEMIYLYLDRIIATKDNDFVITRKNSEYKLIASYNKITNELFGKEILPHLHSTDQAKYVLTDVPGFENERVNVNSALADFMRRFLYCSNKYLYKIIVAYMTENTFWTALARYVTHFNNIEKLCNEMSHSAVVKEIIKGKLEFDDTGKKLKSVVGLPIDIINRMDALDISHYMSTIQTCVKNKTAYPDDVRMMFDFIESLKMIALNKKLKMDEPKIGYMVQYMLEACMNGVNLRTIVNAVARDLLFFDNIGTAIIYQPALYIRDTIEMLIKMNLPIDIPQNIIKWHYITSRNYKIFKSSRAEEYQSVVQEINNKYSSKVGEYLISCPKTEQELLEIGNKYNNCLPVYRDKIIDNNALVFSMYNLDNDGNVIEEIPTVTFEVNKSLDFIQIKTFFDADVTDANVISVLKKWQKKMKGVSHG